jgi:6-phosphogluconolactonase
MKRSGFFFQIAGGTMGAILFRKRSLAAFFEPGTISDLLYIGCYTQSREEGISIVRFDSQNTDIQLIEVCSKVENPSFLIFSHTRQFIYAVNETADFGGKSSGSVSAFRCNEKTGKLTFLNEQPSLGAHPCHLTVDRSGKFILVANYTGGNVTVMPVLPDGQLGGPVDMVQHFGKGINPGRQDGPHAHSVILSPDNRFAFVCDLGIDRIMIYRFDQERGKLSPADSPFFQTAPGAGPRHFTFSNGGQYAFVINELDSTICSFKYIAQKGELTQLQRISTLPDGFTGENTCAEIQVHPNSKFVYASNRGHDSIAVFGFNQESGQLKLLQHQSSLGKTPRNFVIHPSGMFLIAANQNSNTVQFFSLDPQTGKLSETGKFLKINRPVCLLL